MEIDKKKGKIRNRGGWLFMTTLLLSFWGKIDSGGTGGRLGRPTHFGVVRLTGGTGVRRGATVRQLFVVQDS